MFSRFTSSWSRTTARSPPVPSRCATIASRPRRRGAGRGPQWPDPWLSLNPSFASGGSIAELVAEGLLHPGVRADLPGQGAPDDPGRGTLTLHRHQREAIEAAASGKSYVLTTGTGSGKSLAYIVPIVDRVLRERENGGQRTPWCQGDRRLPDERPGQLPAVELEKFLSSAIGRARSPSRSPATPVRRTRTSADGSSPTRPTSCSPTT